MKRFTLLLFWAACQPKQAGAPSQIGPRLGRADMPASFVVFGKIIAQMTPDSLAWPHTVILAEDGRATRLVIRGYSKPGLAFGQGNAIIAWCHAEGTDTVADSVEVR